MLRQRLRERVEERIEEALKVDATPEAVERDAEFDAQCEQAIPANVRMISGCHDTQTSADVQNVASFQLPDPAGASLVSCYSS